MIYKTVMISYHSGDIEKGRYYVEEELLVVISGQQLPRSGHAVKVVSIFVIRAWRIEGAAPVFSNSYSLQDAINQVMVKGKAILKACALHIKARINQWRVPVEMQMLCCASSQLMFKLLCVVY